MQFLSKTRHRFCIDIEIAVPIQHVLMQKSDVWTHVFMQSVCLQVSQCSICTHGPGKASMSLALHSAHCMARINE